MNNVCFINPAAEIKNDVLKSNLSRIKRLPILMFHRVVAKRPPKGPLDDLQFTQENLDWIMDLIQFLGFEAITFSDLLTRALPPKPIILTFDDGYEDNYLYLLPLLKKNKMKAVLFALGDRTVPFNSWDLAKGASQATLLQSHQILEMAESGLVEFGGHSMTHADLSALPPAELEREVFECKRSLEGLLGKPVLAFSYPFGRFNQTVKDTVAAAGFLFGIAVEWGPAYFAEDLLEIRRVCLSPGAGPFEFIWKTSPFYPSFRRFRRALFPRSAPPPARNIRNLN